MKIQETITAKYLYPKGDPKMRLFALWYFGILIALWNLLGHTILGFEQSWATPLTAVAAAFATQLFLAWVDAKSTGQTPRYSGGLLAFGTFFLTAMIPGLAVGMLLYPNESLAPIIFAAALAVASKGIFRAPVGEGQHRGTQHIFNPSNFGITFTLLFIPAVGLAPPYQFTENVTGVWHWIIPGFVLATGILVHAHATGRLPLCLAWIGGFLAQAFLRSWYFDIPWMVPLIPMTSAAFILFTLYMIPDPATTPLDTRRQVAFGLAVAAVYAVLQVAHVVFGLFIALWLVCALRGVGLYLMRYRAGPQRAAAAA
ncbi:MAG: enediyne biosynthesis protein UnbU [Pseudomonadota bacterium]|nr:enediyne biosynthesis protein UnbU [Pseudomonadota bacterium]